MIVIRAGDRAYWTDKYVIDPDGFVAFDTVTKAGVVRSNRINKAKVDEITEGVESNLPDRG